MGFGSIKFNPPFFGKMWGKTVIGRGICEIQVRLPMKNDAMETPVEYMWVDIWCMLDWIVGLCYKTAEMHFPGMNRLAGEYTKCDAAVVADRMKCAKIRIHCKA